MSEDEQESPVEITIGIIGANASHVNVLFADGLQHVPPHVIAGLGGPDEFAKIADDLQGVTFDKFMESFYTVMTSRKVDNYMSNFVSNHFGSKLF